MAIRNFTHIPAASLKEASALLSKSKGKAMVMAGGTDLLGAMKDNIHDTAPETIIDLKTIPGLRYIESQGKTVRIGALTTLAEIAANKMLSTTCRGAFGSSPKNRRSTSAEHGDHFGQSLPGTEMLVLSHPG